MNSDRQIRRKIERKAEPQQPQKGRRWKGLIVVMCVLAILIGAPIAVNAITESRGAEPSTPASPAAAPTKAPESSAPSTQAEPTEVLGNGPQAVSNAPVETYEPVSIPPFEAPTVDRGNPESVAKAWAYVYHSRDNEDALDRFSLTDDYVAEALKGTLFDRAVDRSSPLAGLGASHLESVKFSKNSVQNTPIRWAKEAQATVKTAAGPTVVIDYEIQVDVTDRGWVLTQATELGWTEK